MVQTDFGQNVSFDMRTFRFITTDSSATEAQDQLFTCNLYLKPIGEITSIQPEDCSCHTEADCLNPGIFHYFQPFNTEHIIFDINYANTIFSLWALIRAPSGENVFTDIDKNYRLSGYAESYYLSCLIRERLLIALWKIRFLLLF